MKFVSHALPLVICATALLTVQAAAQPKNGTPGDAPSGPPPRERAGPTTSADVLTQPAIPAPEGGNIIVKFGDTTSIYFKRPIKAVHLDDDLLVKVEPKNDHILAFTGLAPGRSSVTVESKDGANDTYGLVTVVSEPHEVKIYRPSAVNRQSGELRQDSTGNGGYYTIRCNEISCSDAEVAK